MERTVETQKKRSMALEIWRRLRKNKMAMLGLVILVMLALTAIFADVIADYDTKVIAQDIKNRLQGPSMEHWCGTDEFGRDIFARLVHGSRVSLVVGLISVSISLLMGGALGAIAGYYGGRVDNVIMRIMDIFLAVPSILLAMTIVAALGTSLINVMLAIGVSGIPGYARIVRASVMSIKDQEFVEASRAIGAKSPTTIFREILPNCLAPIIVQATLSVAGAILSTASLSFIGLGVQPPIPEWGALISSGREFILTYPYLVTIPGCFIALTVFSFNLMGDALRDAFDPRLKN